jgi:GntR family transcriptional regulator
MDRTGNGASRDFDAIVLCDIIQGAWRRSSADPVALAAKALPGSPDMTEKKARSKLDAGSAVPLYLQIKEKLRDEIAGHILKPGERLPPESALMDRYHVSRITVRQALSQLQAEGLVFKVPGKGTFVSPEKVFQEIGRLEGFAEAMGKQGHGISNRVLSHKVIRCGPLVSQRLDVPADSYVTEIRRVRFLDERPVSLDITYLSVETGEFLRGTDALEQRDIFSILEEDLNIRLSYADLKIEAISPDRETQQILDIADGRPMLKIERLTHDANGQAVDFEFLYVRTDYLQYGLRVERAKG